MMKGAFRSRTPCAPRHALHFAAGPALLATSCSSTQKPMSATKEPLSSQNRDNDEVTAIPTNGVAANGALRICFMSVYEWGAPGW